MGNNFDKKSWTKIIFWTKIIKIKETIEKEKKGDIYKKFKNVFSDVELLEVDKEE